MNVVLSLALALTPVQPRQPPDPELDPFIAKLVKPDDKDTPLRKLQKERVKERAAALARMELAIRVSGPSDPLSAQRVELSGVLWANAAELTSKPIDIADCYRHRVQAREAVEGFVAARVASGTALPIQLRLARINRIAAEIELMKFPEPPPPEIDPFVAGVLKLTDNAARVRALRQELVREQALAVSWYKIKIADSSGADSFAEYVELRCALWRNTAELVSDPTDVVKCYEKRVEAAKELEKAFEVWVKIRQVSPHRWYAVKALLVDAEIDLLKVKASKDAPAPKMDPPKEPALKLDPPLKEKGEFALPKEPALDPFIAELVKPDDKDTPLRKLQKERVRLRAFAIAEIKAAHIKAGGPGTDYGVSVGLSQVLWLNAAELANPADAVKCHEMRVEAAKEGEKFTADRVAKGSTPPQQLNLWKAIRIDAEIDLLRFKEATKGGK